MGLNLLLRKQARKLGGNGKIRKMSTVLAAGAALLALLLFLSAGLDNVHGTPLSLSKTWGEIFDYGFWHIRFLFHSGRAVMREGLTRNTPEGVMSLGHSVYAALIGAAISAPGVAFQTAFRNPVASPSVLGVKNACGAGFAVAMFLTGYLNPTPGLMWITFAVGLSSVLLVLFISLVVGHGQPNVNMVLLIGLITSALFSAIQFSMVNNMSTVDQMNSANQALFGFISDFTAQDLFYYFMLAVFGLLPLYLLRYRINALSFGREQAQALGVRVRVLSAVVLMIGTLIESVAMMLCGTISWVGLMTPHIARTFVGADIRRVLPVSMMAGAILVLFAEDIARMAHLSVGILIAIVGTPAFLVLIAKNNGVRE